ncbi:MAG: hypothetical protein EAZ37_16640, partial [Burkholderiales bacterium]
EALFGNDAAFGSVALLASGLDLPAVGFTALATALALPFPTGVAFETTDFAATFFTVRGINSAATFFFAAGFLSATVALEAFICFAFVAVALFVTAFFATAV